jgi:hypothetical protein
MLSLRDKVMKCGALAILMLSGAQAAWAEEIKMQLFKVITVKDEIVIGLSADDLKTLGGTDASAVAHALAQKGDLTVWQYNVQFLAAGRALRDALRHRATSVDIAAVAKFQLARSAAAANVLLCASRLRSS